MIMRILINLQKLILKKYTACFFDENHHMDSTKAQDYSRISQTNHLTPIRDTFQKLGFPETSTALTIFEQSPTQHRFLMQPRFFNQSINTF